MPVITLGDRDSYPLLVHTVLEAVRKALERFVGAGTSEAIDLRSAPHMDAATYQSLKDVLGQGEVSALVEAELKVEVSETRYPGVWWLTHRDEQGAIVAEFIEVVEIPEILRPHGADIRAGLKRLDQALSESATTGNPAAACDPKP